MSVTQAHFINAITLVVMGLWGYFEVSSPTALIPVGFGGVIFLLTYLTVLKPRLIKPVIGVAVLFTLLILGALVGMRLPKSMDSGGWGLIRVMAMIVTSLFSVGISGKFFFTSPREE